MKWLARKHRPRGKRVSYFAVEDGLFLLTRKSRRMSPVIFNSRLRAIRLERF